MAKSKIPALRKNPDEEILGPAMSALNERQRAWVQAYYETGGNATEASKRAGYAPTSYGSAAVMGCRMRQSPKIQKAMAEYIHGEACGDGIRLGYEVVYKIASNPQHKDQFKAASLLLAMGGMAPITQHKVDMKVELSVSEKVDRLKQMAEILGMDQAHVLGVVDLNPEDYEEVDDAS
jgi:phage terminase small subunit